MMGLKAHLWTVTGVLFTVGSLYFFRFYRDTKDRFFVLFGASFLVFAVHYWLLAAWAVPDEARHWLYLLRLLGFALIVVAVIDKNRQQG